jgi:TonB-linked SusC/RagA family outer membrane protein
MTTVSAGTVYAPVSGNSSKGSALTGSNDDQQYTVTGTVKDAATGEALAGVTILVKGTTTGQITDANGKFSIRIPDREAVLQFSFIGFTPQEIKVQQGSVVNISMVTETKQIDEVVVVGYGTQKKESIVGAITQVNNKALMSTGATTVTNAIAGKLSGVVTIQTSGEPGANAANIYVRGISSWNGSAPLVLVDGVERDFTTLNPNEINTISVLKDASATAVFGAKGANGVIVVTTQRGSLGKPHMDFSASYGYEKATRIPEFIPSSTTMNMLNVAYMNEQLFTSLTPQYALDQYAHPSTPLLALQYPNVNWFKTCTNPLAPTSLANLNISGGTEFAKYFLAFGYQHEGNFFKGTNQDYYDMQYQDDKFNYRINVDFNVTKLTTLSLNVGGALDWKNAPNSSSWRNLYSTGPARFPAYYPSWVLGQVPDIDYPNDHSDRLAAPFGEYTGNPYTTLKSGQFNKDLGSTLFSDLIFKQDLGFITKGLSFNAKVSISSYYSMRQLTGSQTFPEYLLTFSQVGTHDADGNYIPQIGSNGLPINAWNRTNPAQSIDSWSMPPYDVNVGGLNGGYYSNLYYEASLNYVNSFGKNNVSGLFLFNRQQKNLDTQFPYYNEGLVGRATYDYEKKYLLELNVGYTGSERFAPSNRFGFFPSAAIGWVISEEDFFKNAVPWMNKFKVRYSNGMVGSDYAATRWLYTSSYYQDNRGFIREDLLANPMAQWERSNKQDLGFEMGFMKGELTLNVDLFNEYRDKMLLQPKSITFLIGNNLKMLNLGKVKKHGIEIEPEYRKRITPDLEIFVKGIFAWNENRVLFKDDPKAFPDYMKLAGKPLTEMLSVEYGLEGLEINQVQLTGNGHFNSIDEIHNNPSPIALSSLFVGDYKYLDYNCDGTINALDKYPGKGLTYPPITYSFSGGFTWKGFDFNFMFSGNQGKYVQYNQAWEIEFIKGDWRVHASQLDYWTPTNQNAMHQTLHYPGSSSENNLVWGGGEADRGYQTIIEGRYFRNASYLRLKDVQLGYSFKTPSLSRIIGVTQANVYIAGSDLWTVTPLIEGDPEATNFYQGYYPQMAVVRLGIKATF